MLKPRNMNAGTARQQVQAALLERNENGLPTTRGNRLFQTFAVPAGIVGKDRNATIQLRGITERLIQQRCIQLAASEALAGPDRSHRHRSRAEQHRVDFVEIHIDALEHIREWATIIT